MNRMLFDIPSFGFAVAVVSGTILVGAALAVAILARVSEWEAAGRHYPRAEWPLPETEQSTLSEAERKVRVAA
jgi:hypothetical protein